MGKIECLSDTRQLRSDKLGEFSNAGYLPLDVWESELKKEDAYH